MVVSPEIVRLMRERAGAGIKPAQVIREVFNKFGVMSPVYLVDYFMEAFHVRHFDVMPYLHQWWHDPATSDLTDAEFDELLEPLILETRSSWKLPEG
jgi:hypothetical protein